MHQHCNKCGKRKITNESIYCFDCRHKLTMSAAFNYAPEGEHFCQNGNCDNRGKSFRASKMFKVGKYFLCSEKCQEEFKEKYIAYETDSDDKRKTN